MIIRFMQRSHLAGRKLERQAIIYKAIAHPVRLAILRNFATCGCDKLTVKSIYERLGIEQPVASHHLGILKRSGVVLREQEGVNTYYSVCNNEPVIRAVLEVLKKEEAKTKSAEEQL